MNFPYPDKSPGEGNGNPLQYSCLENPMDGGPGRLQSMGCKELEVMEFTHPDKSHYIRFSIRAFCPPAPRGHVAMPGKNFEENYLSVMVLGLCCRASLSLVVVGGGGLSLVWVCQLLPAVACCRGQALEMWVSGCSFWALALRICSCGTRA